MNIISALMAAGLLYLLQSYLYRHYWNHAFHADVSYSTDHAVEGDRLTLIETVTNRKLLPLPIIKIKFTTSKYFHFEDAENSNISDQCYRNDILSVMIYQKITRELPFICSKRGFYTLNHLDIVCSDIFLSYTMVQSLPCQHHLYVYPKRMESKALQITFQKMLGTITTRRFINEDPFEFRGIREYQIYDNIKNINWNASAKTGALKVNTKEFTSSQQVKILVNLEPETIWIDEDLFEASIRIAATLAQNFIQKGIPTAVLTNGIDITTQSSLSTSFGSGISHMQHIHELLARIDSTKEPFSFIDAFQEQIKHVSSSDYTVIISSNRKEPVQKSLHTLHVNKNDYFWLLPLPQNTSINISTEFKKNAMPIFI